MQRSLSIILLCACGMGLHAQIPKLLVEDGSSESTALSKVVDAPDAAKRIAAGQAFLKAYPKSDIRLFIVDQLQGAYLESKQYALAMDAAKELLEVLPGHVASALAGLKAAEGAQDGKLILEWASKASQASKTAIEARRPGETETQQEFLDRKDLAKQVSEYAEYAVFRMSQMPQYAKDKPAILAVMQQYWPSSKYLSQTAQGQTTQTLVKANSANSDEAVQVAEKMIKDGQATADTLLLATSYYFQKRGDKVIQYGQKLIEYANSGSPAQADAADWQQKRRLSLMNAYFMVGLTFSEQERYAQADRYLRQALSYLGGDNTRLATALFHLGFANYKLAETNPDKARINDAIRFTEQCVNMKSPYQAAAAKNLDAFKVQFNIP